MTETPLKSRCVTLQGSARLVTEYLLCGINSILYQRGICPYDSFVTAEHFGMPFFMSTNKNVRSYLDFTLRQIQLWLIQKEVCLITLAIRNVNTEEVLEKWDFNVGYEEPALNGRNYSKKSALPEIGTKDVKLIQKEIRDVIRQITGTVSFLPLLDCPCHFQISVKLVQGCSIPEGWIESKPIVILNSEEVQLRSFSTSIHNMHTIVSYRNT